MQVLLFGVILRTASMKKLQHNNNYYFLVRMRVMSLPYIIATPFSVYLYR